MLCDNLEGWDGEDDGGGEVPEEGDICTPKADPYDTWPKPSQYCKVIIC